MSNLLKILRMKEKFAKLTQKVTGWFQRIPEFSDKNFKTASYVCGILLSLVSIFFIYEMFTVEDFGFNVNWNIFKSFWLAPLWILGVVLAIVNWGKFGHWGAKPVYKDKDGNIYENNDIVDNMFAQLLLPILGHFVFEPLVYACLIYYPVVCVLALLGAVLPYLLALLLVALSVWAFLCSKYVMGLRYRSALLVAVTVLVTAILAWSAISMEKGKADVVETEVVEELPAEISEQVDSTVVAE